MEADEGSLNQYSPDLLLSIPHPNRKLSNSHTFPLPALVIVWVIVLDMSHFLFQTCTRKKKLYGDTKVWQCVYHFLISAKTWIGMFICFTLGNIFHYLGQWATQWMITGSASSLTSISGRQISKARNDTFSIQLQEKAFMCSVVLFITQSTECQPSLAQAGSCVR